MTRPFTTAGAGERAVHAADDARGGATRGAEARRGTGRVDGPATSIPRPGAQLAFSRSSGNITKTSSENSERSRCT